MDYEGKTGTDGIDSIKKEPFKRHDKSNINMINWPVLIKYQGEPELTFVLDQNEWDNDTELPYLKYEADDCIIDSKGEKFILRYDGKRNKVDIKKSGQYIGLFEFEELIKKHMSAINQCCISKLSLRSFKSGIELVQKTVG